MWETGYLNLAQFMLQWLSSSLNSLNSVKVLLNLGKTPIYLNSTINSNQRVRKRIDWRDNPKGGIPLSESLKLIHTDQTWTPNSRMLLPDVFFTAPMCYWCWTVVKVRFQELSRSQFFVPFKNRFNGVILCCLHVTSKRSEVPLTKAMTLMVCVNKA